MQEQEYTDESTNNVQPIYISIDHLKDGNYVLNIMLNNKVIKSIKLKK